MKNRFAIGVLAAACAIGAMAAPGASAAVEFGDNCVGTSAAPPEGSGYTLTTLSSPGPLPLTAPSAGVITKLKLSVTPEFGLPFTVPTSVKVLRSAGGANYTAVAAATLNVGAGVTQADARLPVQAGDRLGLHGLPLFYEGSEVPSLSFYCDEVAGTLGAAKGDVGVGSTAPFEPATEGRVPLAAILEADADGDGYGDETQDLCPLSATTQAACPVVVLDAFAIAGGNAIKVLVATSTTAPVKVVGSAKLGKGASAKLTAKSKTLAPGKIGSFKLTFPGSLKEKLKELEPSKKLTVKITASATNVAGQVSKDKLKARLKGQG
jgi:hypothetical protein